MRVLVATPQVLPSVGGVELHVAETARRTASAGHDVTVLTTDRTGSLPESEETDGVRILRVRAWPPERDWFVAPRVFSVVRRGAWDVVHVQSYHTAVAPLAMLGAIRARIPFVVTFHGGGHSSAIRRRLRSPQLAALRPLLARAAALVAVADFEVDLYGGILGVPPERFVVIPNGADLPAVPARVEARGQAPVIASVGRLERYKGHQHVIAALPHVRRERADARVWIAGSGPYEQTLRETAHRLGVADSVEIRAVPPEDRRRMADELGQAAVVVLASERETHPVAAIEAAALGRPLVVADAPGLRELARSGLARSVAEWRDPAALASAILEEIERPSTPARVLLPTWDDCAAELCALYERVCAGAR
jgi:glycosyltransferase involved in cell wall biosynthesis